MKLQITPTTDGDVQKQFTTFKNPRTGKDADLAIEDAIYWGNRAVQVNKIFCKGDPDQVTVKLAGE